MTRNEPGAPVSSDVWTKLSNEGPQPASELSKITIKLREDGVKKFKPKSSVAGESLSGSGQSPTIYYIEHKHKPKTVIQTWLNEHPAVQNELSAWAIHSRISEYGDEWKAASRELLGPFHQTGGDNSDSYSGTCNLCEKEYQNTLAHHLPECDGA